MSMRNVMHISKYRRIICFPNRRRFSRETLPSGAEALEAAVDRFYGKNVNDDRINEMFEDTDLDALKRHQFNFLRFAFSKRRYEYTGKDMFEAHKNLILHKNLGVFHFDCVAENLVDTLR